MKKILTAVGALLIGAASMTALADNEVTEVVEVTEVEAVAVPDSVAAPASGWFHRGRRMSAERVDSASRLMRDHRVDGRRMEQIRGAQTVTRDQLRDAVRSERQPKPKAQKQAEQQQTQTQEQQ